jgi:hypothetical protein
MARRNDNLQAGKPALKDVNQLGQPIVLIEIRGNIAVEFVDNGMLVANWSQAHQVSLSGLVVLQAGRDFIGLLFAEGIS